MASIGGQTVFSLSPGVPPKGDEVEDISRPGVDGHAFANRGSRSSPTYLQTVIDLTTSGARNSLINTYRAMRGTKVTIIDNWGKSTSNVMVLDCGEIRTQRVYTAVGGINGGGYLLYFSWKVIVP